MLLPLPLLFALQRGLDFALDNDELTRESLSSLDGKVICISVLQPSIKVYLLIVNRRIEIAREFDADVDTTIEGSISALLSLQKANDALYTKEVLITGDSHVANELKAIVSNIDIDFEELLSGLTGDTVAHQLGRLGRGFSSWLSGSSDSLQNNVSEYLQEEVEFLAPNSEVDRFCSDVDEVRSQYDRLQARIQLLEQKH